MISSGVASVTRWKPGRVIAWGRTSTGSLVSRPGVVRNFAYSGGFLRARDNGVIWTPETLDSFLSDPHNYVPGNRMRSEPITDPEQRRRVIARLIEATR